MMPPTQALTNGQVQHRAPSHLCYQPRSCDISQWSSLLFLHFVFFSLAKAGVARVINTAYPRTNSLPIKLIKPQTCSRSKERLLNGRNSVTVDMVNIPVLFFDRFLYTTWKGSMAIATPMYWLIIAPYDQPATSWEWRSPSILSLRCKTQVGCKIQGNPSYPPQSYPPSNKGLIRPY